MLAAALSLGLASDLAVAAGEKGRDAVLDAALRRARLRPEQVGFVFLDPDGKPAWSRNAETLYIVASNNKVVTTAAALALLGPQFTWDTDLYIQGTVRDGTLPGGLWVRGSGDPNISGRAHDGDTLATFRSWADDLRARGIRRIAGGIHLDDTAFDGPAIHPSWPERYWSAWFGAESAALSLSDNCVSVQIAAPAKANRPVTLSLYPATSYVTLINNCMTARRPRGPWGMRRHPERNTIYVSGVIRAGQSPPAVWIPVRDPTLFFGTVLKETLATSGIDVDGEVVRATVPPRAAGLVLLSRVTTGLAESVRITNKRSQNFYAEQLLKTMGHRRHGIGNFDTGLSEVRRFLAQCVGVPPDTYSNADGSGLSRDNRFTPSQLARVLHAMSRSAEGAILRDSLPLAGIDGTLEHRLKDPQLRYRVRAKTGYLAGVSGLSGYLDAASGRGYSFSILVNAEEVDKAAMDRVEEAIVREAFEHLP